MSENACNVNKYAQGNGNGGAMEGPNNRIEKTEQQHVHMADSRYQAEVHSHGDNGWRDSALRTAAESTNK